MWFLPKPNTFNNDKKSLFPSPWALTPQLCRKGRGSFLDQIKTLPFEVTGVENENANISQTTAKLHHQQQHAPPLKTGGLNLPKRPGTSRGVVNNPGADDAMASRHSVFASLYHVCGSGEGHACR